MKRAIDERKEGKGKKEEEGLKRKTDEKRIGVRKKR